MKLACSALTPAVLLVALTATAQMHWDGLPVEIPPPGSSPPTAAEWDAMKQEVFVKASDGLGCEKKMVREWLRVVCRRNGALVPVDVRTRCSEGQQAFAGMSSDVASVVVQVVKRKDYWASYAWEENGKRRERTLIVYWGADRPALAMADALTGHRCPTS
jgi:hypothetical protein